jgi:hypothetical protein
MEHLDTLRGPTDGVAIDTIDFEGGGSRRRICLPAHWVGWHAKIRVARAGTNMAAAVAEPMCDAQNRSPSAPVSLATVFAVAVKAHTFRAPPCVAPCVIVNLGLLGIADRTLCSSLAFTTSPTRRGSR